MSYEMEQRAVIMARLRMVNSNIYHKTRFARVLHAEIINRKIECVVKDESGWLWLCREEIAYDRVPKPYLMPVYGPCPDPIDPLPVGINPLSLAMLRRAQEAYAARGSARAAA